MLTNRGLMATDAKKQVTKMFALADIKINGSRPGDIRVHDERFYQRVLADAQRLLTLHLRLKSNLKTPKNQQTLPKSFLRMGFQDELAPIGSYSTLKTTSYKYDLANVPYRFLHPKASKSVLTNGVLLPA